MKICHVITRLIVGGAQENTIFTVTGLAKRGYCVDVVSGHTSGPEGSLEEVLTSSGIRLIRLRHLVREINPLFDVAVFFKLLFFFKREGYDIIHTHSAKAGILARLSARIACSEAIVVHTVHGLSFHSFQSMAVNRFYIFMERFAARFTDHFICVGEVMKRRSVEVAIGSEKDYSVIYSGFELTPYLESESVRDATREKLGIKGNEKVIGMIGRLYYLKGQEYLLEAFADIAADRDDVRLMLVGGGILKQEFQRYTEEKGIAGKVIFTGLVPPATIPQLVSAMDILAHTSLREGLPKAVAQGFAGGKPVVAFDVDGACELVIDGETGFLVAPGDVVMLKEKLRYLLQNPHLSYKMGIKGRRLVENRFSVNRMVDDIEAVYTRLFNEKKTIN